MHMLPPNSNLDHRQDISELARFFTELSVIDYYFVTRRTSSVALAGLLNAMEILRLDEYAPQLLNQLTLLDGFDPFDAEILECRQRLHELYAQGGYAKPIAPPAEPRTDTVSPVCVSAYGRSTPQPQKLQYGGASY